MKIKRKNRKFKTGITDIVITHVADLKLKNDELITFKVNNKTEYDVTRKNWGFYSTPSINKRLLNTVLYLQLLIIPITGPIL